MTAQTPAQTSPAPAVHAVRAGNVGSTTQLVVAAVSCSRRYAIAKRAVDVVVASALLVVLAPLFGLIALAIKLDSRGPALYVAERIGTRRVGRNRRGQEVWEPYSFAMYKFRSMVHNADQTLHVLHVEQYTNGTLDAAVDGGDAKFKLHNDPRVTRVGRLLRRTSIDELPQLLNVIKGEMTLVGPRPVPAYEVAHYEPADYERFTAKPGLTGLWQVSGRADLSFAEMISLDIEYAQRRSLALDAEILAKTFSAISSGRGAQ